MSNLYQFQKWISYRSKAQSRHGVHSPFVYDFSEKVLYKQSRKDLKKRLVNFFSDYQIIWNTVPTKYPNEKTLVIHEDIYLNRKKTAEWEKFMADESVKLSIDLYDFGLLFYKKDFLEKQHFILK